ncbi:hypothetical protein SAY86_006104 [Trapa natans]|uniref:RING-type domain-containing protein n=1 Tax=Trapa natans TaxID=22666 RepID=A0AAN7QVN1_TRANT|nr:hypothetical protein SAY86_006104 [Trapa natans]
MGLKSEGDRAADEDGGGKSVPCSICLEVVADNGDRSWAKLQCGHQFHLADCIGSAFNVKGAMQCPNCRKVEKGQWLYANDFHSLPDFGMDEWTYDDDIYDLAYSEMASGVHWCPFGQLSRFPSSFEETDFSSVAYLDVLGQHATFSEQTISVAHPCPYVGYLRPTYYPSTSSSRVSVVDASFSNQWRGPGTEIALGPPTVLRSSRSHADMPRSGSIMPPLHVGHTYSLGMRPGNSVASGVIPSYPGSNAQNQDRVQSLQAYYQQQQPSGGPAIHSHTGSSARRFTSYRGMVASSSELSSGLYFMPTNYPPGLNLQELEDPVSTGFPAWEREPLPSGRAFFPLPSTGGSEPSIRPAIFRQRHRPERTPSHNQP